MATTDPEDREQLLEAAEALLLAKYADGRPWLDPVRAMHAVRAAADGYDAAAGPEAPDVPAADLLAALTQLTEARAALDTLERDLTRGARQRGASWTEVAASLDLASRSSAESRYTRLERSAATYRGDRYPDKQRAERARDRAADAWIRAHEPRLRDAVWNFACVNDRWPQLARHATADQFAIWVREDDGAALAARLRDMQLLLDAHGDTAPTPEAIEARDEALALLAELRAARHGLPAPGAEAAG